VTHTTGRHKPLTLLFTGPGVVPSIWNGPQTRDTSTSEPCWLETATSSTQDCFLAIRSFSAASFTDGVVYV
jgi:hypothetical protein